VHEKLSYKMKWPDFTPRSKSKIK